MVISPLVCASKSVLKHKHTHTETPLLQGWSWSSSSFDQETLQKHTDKIFFFSQEEVKTMFVIILL